MSTFGRITELIEKGDKKNGRNKAERFASIKNYNSIENLVDPSLIGNSRNAYAHKLKSYVSLGVKSDPE